MKYSIKEFNINRWNKGYKIGTGYRTPLTWQGAGIVFLAICLLIVLGYAALATFVTAKVLAFVWAVPLAIGGTYGILQDTRRYGDNPLRIMPYRHDKWDEVLQVKSDEGKETVRLLNKVLKYPEISNFVDTDELIAEVVSALKLRAADKLTLDELFEYNDTLNDLIDECENRKYTELLRGKESHDSTVKAALKVAKSVNGDLR